MDVFDTPSRVEAHDGVVLINGPDGIAFAMTAQAAQATAEALREAAAQAATQLADGNGVGR